MWLTGASKIWKNKNTHRGEKSNLRFRISYEQSRLNWGKAYIFQVRISFSFRLS